MKFLSLVLALSIAPACAQTVATPPIPSDGELRQMLVTRVDAQKQATGVVLGIVGPRGKRLVVYGTMGVDDKRPVGGDTVFEIGSVTKVFTALLLSDMVRRGELQLDDPAAKFLPVEIVRLPARNGRQIELADLATHTSGLPLRPTNLVSKDPGNKYAGYTADLLFQFLSSFEPTRDSGSEYEYSNVGYGLLGQVLSRRSGRSYADLVETRITKPLHMLDTRIEPTRDMQARSARGYGSDLAPAPHWDLGALESAGAYRSTANDLMIFLEAVLGYRKSTLAPAMKAMLDTRRPGGMEPSTQIALAWNVYVDGTHEIVWKNGSASGFRAFIGYDPGTRVGVVALANAQTAIGVDDIGLHILDPKIPVDLHVPVIHKEIAIDPAILDRYIGRYQYSPTDILIVTREGKHLFGQSGQDKYELFAESDHDFFLKVLDAQITFVSSKGEPATVAIWHQGGQDQRGERIP